MKSVLSIQSHVVHGYVGGKAAIFPLQTQGWDVDNINTVNYSNHTGYGSFKGSKLSSEELKSIFNQLMDLNIHYDAILTGYIPNAELIQIINDFIIEYKQTVNPKVTYLLDPVMGDNNYLYVDKSCIGKYHSILNNKIVDLITPNQFELELLTNVKIDSNTNLIKAVDIVHHDFDIKNVIVTSVEMFNDDFIHCIVSVKDQVQKKEFKVPRIKSYFTGVGDLFSALLLDKYYTSKEEDIQRLTSSVNQVLTIMEMTLKLTAKNNGTDLVGKINDSNMKYFELRIIESRDYYNSTETKFIEYDL